MRPSPSRSSSSSHRLYLSFLAIAVVITVVSFSSSSYLLYGDQGSIDQHDFFSRNAALLGNDIVESKSGTNISRAEINNRALFYNIFVPDASMDEVKNALDIVYEQLSFVAKSGVLKQSTVVYYTLIGKNTTDAIQQYCVKLGVLCDALLYTQEGNEDLTLQSLHDYCSSSPDALVTYMHSKGSFHPSVRNDNLRLMATKSILSDECQTLDEKICNVCGARFSTFPHYHMAANMFTSNCLYIRKLLPPNIFATKMEEMMTSVLLSPTPGLPRPTFAQVQHGYSVGTGRFAYEHWLGSHPHIRPCDVYPMDYQFGYKKCPARYIIWKPDLQKAPRYDLSTFMKGTVDRGSWFCGQARLYEYRFLYRTSPPPSSFVWDYYHEAFKGCPEPLELTKHQELFAHLVGSVPNRVP
jgi:hypothetical protein